MKKLALLRSFGVILLLSAMGCDLSPGENGEPMPGQDGKTPVVAIYPAISVINLPDKERVLFNGTKFVLHLHTILLPYNCPVSFVIVNEGPVGTDLKYSVDDVGALGGFLDYTNGSGSLKSGEFATVSVTVDPNFTKTGLGGLGESELVLTIHTPNASNSIKTPVSVHIRDYEAEVKKLCGTWQGTWTGTSIGPLTKTAPVNGTWTFNLLTVDWATNSGTSTLLWSGNEAWWDLALNDEQAKNSMPHTVNFNRSYVYTTKVTWITGASPCLDGVNLHVPHSKYFGYFEEIGYVPDPSGLGLHLNFSADLKSLKMEGAQNSSSWSSQWWNPNAKGATGYMNGKLSGSKIN